MGIGRPALHGLAAFGQQGVERVISLLRYALCPLSLVDILLQQRGTGNDYATLRGDYIAKYYATNGNYKEFRPTF